MYRFLLFLICLFIAIVFGCTKKALFALPRNAEWEETVSFEEGELSYSSSHKYVVSGKDWCVQVKLNGTEFVAGELDKKGYSSSAKVAPQTFAPFKVLSAVYKAANATKQTDASLSIPQRHVDERFSMEGLFDTKSGFPTKVVWKDRLTGRTTRYLYSERRLLEEREARERIQQLLKPIERARN